MTKKSAKQKEIDPVWMERYGHEPTFEEIFAYFGYPEPRKEKLGEPMYMPETTCFGFDDREKSTGCTVLKKTYCCYGKCNFYKDREQYREELKNDALRTRG